jgi:aminoglycoside phosphotransferase (APT) family kinase protein
MRDEAERLATAVAASAAFEQPATAPVHGDLWLENLLTTPRGSWHVLDWDDVRLGDPVVDWATVFGPSPGDVRPVEEEELPDAVSLGAAEAERLRLYARATLLDWIVDPLADWIDAAAAGAAEARVRAEKERVHRAAKAFYLDSYGSD